MTDPRLSEQDANQIIEEQLKTRLCAIEEQTQADAIAYIGPIADPVHDFLRTAIEGLGKRRRKLLVVLETNGGYMETAERIALVFRHNYSSVEFIVPGQAMSAGTVLVMSGDAIHMDYSSILGPIDPQVQRPGSEAWVPALGYLKQYERLIEKSRDGSLTTAELMYLVQSFNPAELYQYEQEKELSVALLKEWLVKYKFRNWRTTEARGARVTKKMREQRAEEIARQLNDTERWHSHSRGIPMEVLRRELKLQIDDFEIDSELGAAIRAYYRLLKDYMGRLGHFVVWHTRERHNGI